MTMEIRVPQLPESVADATLVAWRKQPGDTVSRLGGDYYVWRRAVVRLKQAAGLYREDGRGVRFVEMSMPVGSPAASSTKCPFSGSGVPRSTPAIRRADELAQTLWALASTTMQGRSGTARSSTARVRLWSPK